MNRRWRRTAKTSFNLTGPTGLGGGITMRQRRRRGWGQDRCIYDSKTTSVKEKGSDKKRSTRVGKVKDVSETTMTTVRIETRTAGLEDGL